METSSTGRPQAIPAASPRWLCTAVRDRAPVRSRGIPSTPSVTASFNSTSAAVGRAVPLPPTTDIRCQHNPPSAGRYGTTRGLPRGWIVGCCSAARGDQLCRWPMRSSIQSVSVRSCSSLSPPVGTPRWTGSITAFAASVQRRGNGSATECHLRIGMAICWRPMPGSWATPTPRFGCAQPRTGVSGRTALCLRRSMARLTRTGARRARPRGICPDLLALFLPLHVA
jgi:hypothetical protein